MRYVHFEPKKLIWARNLRRFELKAAARLIKIPSADLRAYEAGTKKMTLGILETISKKYAVPTATLMIKSNVPIPKMPIDYRTLVGRPVELSPDTMLVIDRIRTYQRKLAQLMSIEPTLISETLPNLTMIGDPAMIGERERNRIGISVNEQLGWNDDEEAFRKWRRIIEAQGVCIYMEKFEISDCRGISFLDSSKLAAIVINKNEQRRVGQIFSLLHEYAHVLIRKPGISDWGRTNSVENFCNRFAASFLMPLEILKRVLGPWPDEPITWKNEVIVHAAHEMKVSQQSLALRLEDLGVAPIGFFAKFTEQQEKKEKRDRGKDEGGPGYTVMRAYELGRRFPRTILSAVKSGILSSVDAAVILNTPAHLFPTLERRVNG